MDDQNTRALRRRLRQDFEAGVTPAVEIQRQCAAAGLDVAAEREAWEAKVAERAARDAAPEPEAPKPRRAKTE